MKKKSKMNKKPKSRYCAYHAHCDKDIDCKYGGFCSVFQHTTEFSSLKLPKEE